MTCRRLLFLSLGWLSGCALTHTRDEPDQDARIVSDARDAEGANDAHGLDAHLVTDASEEDARTASDVDADDLRVACNAPPSRAAHPLDRCNSTMLRGELGAFPRIGSIGTGPFTFETWLKTRERSVSVIAGYRDPGPEEVGFLFGLYIDRVFVQLRSVPNRRSADFVGDGEWHHVVVRRNEVGELSALVDFVPASVEFPTTSRDIDPSAATLHIGADSATSDAPYVGQLRLTRIWGCERSDARIQADAQTVFGPREGLLFELPLDEVGSTVQETIGPTTLTMSPTAMRVTDCLPAP